tara:strand:- start:73 stop:354 length:282 start_codon:yes stop_codon:yes gene_type:complete
MVLDNYIEFFIQYSLTSKLYIKFLILLFLCYFSFVIFNGIFNIVKFFKSKYSVKNTLLTQESNLINLRKKYLDGKINAREYKLNTIQILNSKK